MIREAIAHPPMVATDGMLAQFANQREKAVRRYSEFVAQEMNQTSIWLHLNRQVFLGDDHFVSRMQEKIKEKSQDINIPKAQRPQPTAHLVEIAKTYDTRNETIGTAHATGGYIY